jgi:DNA-binding LacI/PurR family transcriptional regulator
LEALDIPVVFLDRYLDLDHDNVGVDDIGGARAVTDHLAGLGHRRIAFVHAESRQLSSVKRRLSGYRSSLRNNGLEYDRSLVVRVGVAMDRALDGLLAIADPPTAAFCVNDVVAVQLFTALRDRRLDIPGDFSVAGFDALEVLPSPGRLTSVRRPTEQMGRRGIELLAARLDDPTAPPRHIEFATELVVGDTTAPPHFRAGRSAGVRRAKAR